MPERPKPCDIAGDQAKRLRRHAQVGGALGSGPRNRVHRTSSRTFTTSGSSEAWYRARFGTERSRVRIPPSRPLTHGFTEPAAAESAAANPKSARIDSGQKNDPFKEFERSVRVRVNGGVPGRCSYRSDAR